MTGPPDERGRGAADNDDPAGTSEDLTAHRQESGPHHRSKPGVQGPGTPKEYQHRLVNPVRSFLWLREELGQRRLSGYFTRGGHLVYTARVHEDGYVDPDDKRDDNGPVTVRLATAERIRVSLALHYWIYRMTKEEVDNGDGTTKVRMRETDALFPAGPSKMAVEAGREGELPNARLLTGVITTPIVRRDGSILSTPGYDPATGLLYVPDLDVPDVPEHPTADQMAAAVKLLTTMLDEFVWFGPDDLANYLGLMITPLLRALCPPPYKLGAIMARQPGSGKSLLAEVIRIVHGGVFRTEVPSTEEEWGKQITAILYCTTAPVVQFDNVTGMLKSSKLAGLLTSDVISDRPLGATADISMTNDRLWLLTGNNLLFGGDLTRRTIWVTIDPGVPHPEARKFKLNLPVYVREHRGELLAALLTIVAAWASDGGPRKVVLDGGDGFAYWVAATRAILKHAKVPGTFDSAGSAQQRSGAEDTEWGEFLVALRKAFPDDPRDVVKGKQQAKRFTTADILAELPDKTSGDKHRREPPGGDDLVEALPPELHEKYLKARESPRAIAKSLGRWFMNREGRWAGDLVARRDPEPDKGSRRARWYVEGLPPAQGELFPL